MVNNVVAAADNSVANATPDVVEGLIGYCSTYSYAVLWAALAFLAAGLVFVMAAAYFEARKAKAEAERLEAEARKAAAEAVKAEAALAEQAAGRKGSEREAAPMVVPVNAVTTFIKSFAAVLGDAKAWVAMVLIGLLLLWMAGAAPGNCGTSIVLNDGNQTEEPGEGDNASGNEADVPDNAATDNVAENESENAL